MAGIQMKRNFHGLQVIDDELLMAFCIAYRSTQCSECNSYGDGYGTIESHRLRRREPVGKRIV
jgi:hypothetical protein